MRIYSCARPPQMHATTCAIRKADSTSSAPPLYFMEGYLDHPEAKRRNAHKCRLLASKKYGPTKTTSDPVCYDLLWYRLPYVPEKRVPQLNEPASLVDFLKL